MYVDLEGVNISRDQSVSIRTLLIDTATQTIRVCLLDVHLLGSPAFNTAGVK
jgi:exonuclease 3'-5' domain-containing protein 1